MSRQRVKRKKDLEQKLADSKTLDSPRAVVFIMKVLQECSRSCFHNNTALYKYFGIFHRNEFSFYARSFDALLFSADPCARCTIQCHLLDELRNFQGNSRNSKCSVNIPECIHFRGWLWVDRSCADDTVWYVAFDVNFVMTSNLPCDRRELFQEPECFYGMMMSLLDWEIYRAVINLIKDTRRVFETQCSVKCSCWNDSSC